MNSVYVHTQHTSLASLKTMMQLEAAIHRRRWRQICVGNYYGYCSDAALVTLNLRDGCISEELIDLTSNIENIAE